MCKFKIVGEGNYQREVRILIGKDSPLPNMIVGETVSPAGNWSGTPPHKHSHHELYYFRTKGFGILKLDDDLKLVKDGDIVYIPPMTYHQVVASPDSPLSYFFFIWGKGKDVKPVL